MYASAYVSAAARASFGSEAAVATRTTRSPRALKNMPNACTPEAARLLTRARMRVSRSSSAWTATQSTAAIAQPATRQPATRKTGSASARTSALPSAGSARLGTGRGVENSADLASDPERAERPPDEGADREGRRRDADQDPTGSGGLERLARAWLHPPG